MLIVFDDMIADMEVNKKLSSIVTELFSKGKKTIVFKRQETQHFTYFKVLKTVRLNVTHYFIMKVPNKTKLQQIAFNHSSNIDFKDFLKLYKDYTKESYRFLVNDTTLSSDNPLQFGKNLLQK